MYELMLLPPLSFDVCLATDTWHVRSQDTTLNREEGNLPQYATNSFPEQASGTPPQGLTDWANLHPPSHALNHVIFHLVFIIKI